MAIPFYNPKKGTRTSSRLKTQPPSTVIKTGVSGRQRATGGTITYMGQWTIHTFLSNGTFTPLEDMEIDYLIVAGGGGGGGSQGGFAAPGAGGAGGLLQGVNFSVTPQNYTISIGGGGPGGAQPNPGTQGTNTTALGFTAIGGGFGAARANGSSGGNGGSGGGANNGTAGSGTAGQGFAGGSGANGCSGGGAGGIGGVTTPGPGLLINIDGNDKVYAKGGTSQVTTPVNATANTGNGGDAANANGNNGANGGSGIVIVRYKSL